MKAISSVCILAMVFSIAGCVTHVPRPAGLEPGPQPTAAEAEKAARDYLATALKDPDSLKQFAVLRVYAKEWQDMYSMPWHSAWVVCFQYNAKNSYGAYGGVHVGAIAIKGNPPVLDYIAPDITLSFFC